MQRRKLGRTELEVPVVCFGAYAIGGGYWGAQDASEAIAAMRASIDAGANAIDTAPVYGLGRSEELVGEAIRGRRDEVVVMTKCGVRFDELAGLDDMGQLTDDGTWHKVERNSRPESVRLEVERSCKRLGVERLDLVQVHARDPRVPVAETMGALAELRAEGRLREIGVSNYSVEEICEARRALGEVPLASDQPEYSLLSRGIERELLPVAREDGIGLLVYSPLAQGLLTGKVRADRRFRPGEGRAERNEFQLENRRRVNELLDRVVAPVAERLGATLGQVALAWVAAQPGVTAALVSARTPDQARENAAAGDLKLEPEEIRRIGEAFARLELVQPGGWRTRIRAWLRKLHGGR